MDGLINGTNEKRYRIKKNIIDNIMCFDFNINYCCSYYSNSKVQNTVNKRTSVQEDTSVDDTNNTIKQRTITSITKNLYQDYIFLTVELTWI